MSFPKCLSPVFIFQRVACWTPKHSKLVLMIVTHENGELLFPGYLHEISNLHIQLGGDISPSLWVPGSLRFLVSTSFLCQHENCHFSQLGKYFLRCGSGDFHFCSWLCRSSRGGKRNVFIYNVVPNFN